MKKNLLILVALLTSATISAQNGGTIMKKYENQLPQTGREMCTLPTKARPSTR